MRRLWACLAALAIAVLVPQFVDIEVRLLAAAPTLGQHPLMVASSAGVAAVNATALTDTSTLIGAILQNGGNARTYGVSDPTNGAYTSITRTVGATSIGACELFYMKDITAPGTNLTITATQAGGAAVTFQFYVVEVLGASRTAPLDPTGFDAVDDGSTMFNHDSASPGITTAGDNFVFTGAVSAGVNAGTRTVTSSPAFSPLTADLGGSSQLFAQYYSNVAGLTNNTVTWSGSTQTRVQSCVATFLATAAVVPSRGLTLLGVG